MPICSMSTRVDSVSANTPPPAFTTNVLPLYMRMYGAALFSARIASAWSTRCMIIVASFSLQHPIQHRHLDGEPIGGLAQHETARTVEHFVRHGGVAPHGQAVHELAAARRAVEPAFAHAPVGERRA